MSFEKDFSCDEQLNNRNERRMAVHRYTSITILIASGVLKYFVMAVF